jgi:hypothetical protein
MPIASRAAADRSTAYLWPSMTTVFVQWILTQVAVIRSKHAGARAEKEPNRERRTHLSRSQPLLIINEPVNEAFGWKKSLESWSDETPPAGA